MYSPRHNRPPRTQSEYDDTQGYNWQSGHAGRGYPPPSASRYDSGPYGGYGKHGQYSRSPPPHYSKPPRSRWSDTDDDYHAQSYHQPPPHSRYPTRSDQSYGGYNDIDPNYHNRHPPRYTPTSHPSRPSHPFRPSHAPSLSQAEIDDIRDTILTSTASQAGLTPEQTLVFRYFGASAAEQAKFTLDDMVDAGLMDDATADTLEHVSQQPDGIWPAVDLLHEYLAETWLGQDGELVQAMLAEVDERTEEMGLPVRRSRGRLFEYKSRGSASMGGTQTGGETTGKAGVMVDRMRAAASIDRDGVTSTPDQLHLQDLAGSKAPPRSQDTQTASRADTTRQPPITSSATDTTQLQQPTPRRPPQPSVADADDTSIASRNAPPTSTHQEGPNTSPPMHSTTASDHYGTTRPGDRVDMSLEARLQSTMAGMKETQDRWDDIDRIRTLVRAADWNMLVGPENPAQSDTSSRFHFDPSELDQETLDRIKPPPEWKARDKAAQLSIEVKASVEDGITYDVDGFTQSVASTLGMTPQQSDVFKAYAKSQTPEERNTIGSNLLQTVRKDKEHVERDLGKVFAAQEILSAAERYVSSFQSDAEEVAKMVRSSGMDPQEMEEFSRQQLGRALAIAHRSEACTDESYAPYFQLNFHQDIDVGDDAARRQAFESMASEPDSRYMGFAGRS